MNNKNEESSVRTLENTVENAPESDLIVKNPLSFMFNKKQSKYLPRWLEESFNLASWLVILGALSLGYKRVKEIHHAVTYEAHTENVIAGPQPETFYEENGTRYYSKIDGKTIEEYLNGK